VDIVENTLNLTPGYEPELAEMMKQTEPGQAHWAGSGTSGRTCGECGHYGYWKRVYNKSGDIVTTRHRQCACGKFYQLTAKHGDDVSPTARTCRYFEQRS
jgi:hypothetical protein